MEKLSKNKPGRRAFLKHGVAAASVMAVVSGSRLAGSPKAATVSTNPDPEWRNRQEGMEYRRLGRTGFMVSAMVVGGGGLSRDNYRFIARAIERGVNYIDTASRYGNGRSEEGVGEVIRMAGRDKLFITTKLSEFTPFLDELCDDVFKSLPSDKQEAIRKRARERVEELGVMRPGYYVKFFPPQDSEMPRGHLTYQIRKEYGQLKKWKSPIRKELNSILDRSLARLGTDTIDILMCPHGARLPEELEDETIRENLEAFRKAGKIRHTGLSIHSDVPRNLVKAADLGHYDVAMVAYNIVNQAGMDMPVNHATDKGMGIIAMKAASAVNPPENWNWTIPQWRIDKLNTAIPEPMKTPLKGYLWVHQNPRIAGIISDFKNEAMIDENLAIVGRRVELARL